jgi:hypothetical protein
VTSALEGGGWSALRHGRFVPGKEPVPTVQEVGWAPGPVSTVAKYLAPTGFDPRTLQSVASRVSTASPTLICQQSVCHIILEIEKKISTTESPVEHCKKIHNKISFQLVD